MNDEKRSFRSPLCTFISTIFYGSDHGITFRYVYLNVRIPLILFLIACSPAFSWCQGSAYIDSLENELAISDVRDTNRAIVLYRLCWEYRKTQPVKAEQYGNEALELSIGLKFQKGIGASYNNLGGVYEYLGDDVKALRYYTLALDAKRKSGDPKSIASTLNNIGIIYKRQEYFDIALKFYHEAAAINEQTGNKRFLMSNYHNIGNCHKSKNNFDSAFYYYNLAGAIAVDIQAYNVFLDILTAKGNSFVVMNMPDSALLYFDSTIHVAQRQGIGEIAHFYFHDRGRVFLNQDNLDSAGYYLGKAWALVENSNDWVELNSVSSSMAVYCQKKYVADKNPLWLEKAYDFMNIAYTSRDSLVNQKRQNSIFNFMMEDVVKQKDDEIRIVEQEKEVVNLKADNERLFRNFLGVIVFAIALLLLVLWMRYRKNRLLTQKLAEQNIQIEEKKKEIIDSITYAKRLQDAILPPVSLIRQFFPETFVLYLPKDIVAGDFYWMETSGDRLFIAAADCTGHGVPGAMVSVVCANALERTVNEFGIRETGKILDKTRELVLGTFGKSNEMVNDGMDISLLSLSLNPLSPGNVMWSGANNPLWIIRDGELTEHAPDKQPIGRFEHARPFTTETFELQKGDMLYIFTDGYADQFGGPKGKKFKYSNLKSKLKEIAALTATEQQTELEKTISEWRGSIEQLDDICIIGIRI